jgi:hypothetical protein
MITPNHAANSKRNLPFLTEKWGGDLTTRGINENKTKAVIHIPSTDK